jgi:hypothetical protein
MEQTVVKLSEQQYKHLHRIRDIKSRYENGEWLRGGDAKYMYMVLRNHPRAKDKIGVGVQALFIHEYVFGSRCFWVLRKDGTLVDWSAPKVVRGNFEPRSASTLAAMLSFTFGRIRRDLRSRHVKPLQQTGR